mgnify:CR=1 FL=1
MFGWQSRQDTLLLEVMREILATQKMWLEKMLVLEEEKLRLDRLRLEGAKPLTDVPLGQLRVDEDQQDADWALKQGIISPAEYKELLSVAGLEPSDLEFA